MKLIFFIVYNIYTYSLIENVTKRAVRVSTYFAYTKRPDNINALYNNDYSKTIFSNYENSIFHIENMGTDKVVFLSCVILTKH